MNSYLQMKQSNEKTELKIDTIKVFNTKTKIYKYVQLISYKRGEVKAKSSQVLSNLSQTQVQ